MNDLPAALLALEQAIVRYDAPPEPDGGIAVLPGRGRVLISAPHAACHWRQGYWKPEDEYTAALAHWLHQHTGAHAIYPTRRVNPDPHDDANQGRYKALLRDVVQAQGVRLVLDLHGARGDRDFGVALGTIHSKTCRAYEPHIIQAFEAAGFQQREDYEESALASLDRLAVNPPRYTGGLRLPTVTRFAWKTLGIAAVQIEINSHLRVVRRLPSALKARYDPHFRGDAARIARVVAALVQIIEYVNAGE